MDGKLQPIEDLRRSERHNTDYIPVNLISNYIDYDYGVPARLNNVSLGGIQLLCGYYAARQLLKSKNCADDQDSEVDNLILQIPDRDDFKPFELSCKLVYINQNHSPNDYCSTAIGLESPMDDPIDRRILSCFINRNA